MRFIWSLEFPASTTRGCWWCFLAVTPLRSLTWQNGKIPPHFRVGNTWMTTHLWWKKFQPCQWTPGKFGSSISLLSLDATINSARNFAHLDLVVATDGQSWGRAANRKESNTGFIQGSFYCQAKQRTVEGKSCTITIHLHSLIFSIWSLMTPVQNVHLFGWQIAWD